MDVTKQEYEILQNALDQWGKENLLTPEEVARLKTDLNVQHSQRQTVAQYFFIIALSCSLLAFGAIFIDEKLLEQLKKYFSISDIVIALVTGAITTTWFWYIYRTKNRLSNAAYEVYQVFGALGMLTSLVYFIKTISPGGSYTVLFSVSGILLFLLSILFRSRALWVCALLALVIWFGNFTTDHSKAYLFLGMNYAVRYTVFGLVLLLASWAQLHIKQLLFSQRITYIIGLFLFFSSLWAVSIFGNVNYLSEWTRMRQLHVIGYSVVFALAAIISFASGIRYKDDVARDMGILFLLANLYTRYFEFFWDSMNKGLFFLIIAITFGLLGRQLQRKKHDIEKQ